eukprot:COSAG01_NODE_61036_length_291_cov_1.083333_1_plen_22_part_10
MEQVHIYHLSIGLSCLDAEKAY